MSEVETDHEFALGVAWAVAAAKGFLWPLPFSENHPLVYGAVGGLAFLCAAVSCLYVSRVLRQGHRR